MRDYHPDEYDQFVYECILRSNSIPYLGYFGTPEISFIVQDKAIAKQMMKDYNQHSIYDLSKNELFKNNQYDYKTNPPQPTNQ